MKYINFLTKSLKYDILCFMRILYAILLMFFVTSAPSFAGDEVQRAGSVLEGKITAYSDGLINLRSGGVDYSFVRSKNHDFYGDYIIYRERPILGGSVQTNCRISFIDKFYVIFETPEARIQVPRYRVSTLILNAN